LVPGSSPGGTTLKTPLLEGFFVFISKNILWVSMWVSIQQLLFHETKVNNGIYFENIK